MPVAGILIIIEAVAKYGPELVLKLIDIFRKETINDADIEELRAIVRKPYGLTADANAIAAWANSLPDTTEEMPDEVKKSIIVGKTIKSVKHDATGWIVCYTDGTCIFTPTV